MTYTDFRRIERTRDITNGFIHLLSDLEAYTNDQYDLFYELAEGEKKPLASTKVIPLSEVRKDIETLEQIRVKYGHLLMESVDNIVIKED